VPWLVQSGLAHKIQRREICGIQKKIHVTLHSHPVLCAHTCPSLFSISLPPYPPKPTHLEVGGGGRAWGWGWGRDVGMSHVTRCGGRRSTFKIQKELCADVRKRPKQHISCMWVEGVRYSITFPYYIFLVSRLTYLQVPFHGCWETVLMARDQKK